MPLRRNNGSRRSPPPTIEEETFNTSDYISDSSSKGASYAANDTIPRDLQAAREAYALGDSELSRLAHQTRELAELASGETSQLVSVGDDDVIKAHALSGEVQEMMYIYRNAGLSDDDANTVAHILSKYPEFWVDHMLLHEVGLLPSRLDQQTRLRTPRYVTNIVSYVVLAGFLPCLLIIRGFAPWVVWLFSEIQLIGGLLVRSRNKVEKGQKMQTQRPDVSKDNLHRAFRRYGDIKEVYVPTDPSNGQGRGFAFVEYVRQESAEDAMSEMNNQQFENSVIQLVFVEPKDKHDRGREADRDRGRGHSHQGLSYQQPPPPPPPHIMGNVGSTFTITAPATNPSSDSSRYNTTAGDFIIDAAGRLTRRLPVNGGSTEMDRSRSRSPTAAGAGTGLLTAGAANNKKDDNAAAAAAGGGVPPIGSATYRPPACIAQECPLHPALVVDYSKI
ncbi:hypothetical protein FOL47_008898 [Perkinsus chesapeaki]|uniref:RRM domain-containing protein n=1 Tax=Perkinsus chesapeaki TaxID=330153 RepID=A0A7J6LBD5_PERCH|nr:hypothetical protein FOL47_008898 [Perkinsus chesapeaki]